MQKQMIGEKVSPKSEPRNTLPDNHKSGQSQMIGNTVPLQTSPSTVKYGAGTSNGTMQMTGEMQKLSTKPFSGWQSDNTGMSERTIEQKKVY